MRFVYIAVLCCVFAIAASAAPVTTPLAVSKTAHITLDKDEVQDIAITLLAGKYYIICDVKRVDGAISNIIGGIKWLKSNGVPIDNHFLHINELAAANRVGKLFAVTKNIPSRFRVTNDIAPFEAWITFVPEKSMKFFPYAFAPDTPTALAIGEDKGKGGTLDKKESVFHTITLPAGPWFFSIHFETIDGKKHNLIGSLEFYDKFGYPVKDISKLHLNQIGQEGREEKKINLLKPTTLFVRVTNIDAPVKYIVDIYSAK
ncbi:MAG: hypothetical protein ACYC7E_07865 [Armatimonadota bacterium]